MIPQHLSVSINARKAQMQNNLQSSVLLYPEAAPDANWVPPPDLVNTMLFSVTPGYFKNEIQFDSTDWQRIGL